ncbi:MAG: 50S ribosomal protein L13 [Patescibacteria group bacterium]
MKNQQTFMQRKEDVTREWHLVDVKGKVLGRVATEIAEKLIGKNKPTYTPHVDGGDYVVVINAKEVAVTGGKEQKKIYYRHSGFPGGLKQRTFEEMIQKNPEEVIFLAVKNMLPKNRLQGERLARLKIYAAAEHKHESQLGGK